MIKRKHQFLQSIASFGIAAAACLAFGTITVSAETLKTDSIGIDYSQQKITVDLEQDSTDQQILFGISSVSKNVLKSTAWEIYDVPEAGKAGSSKKVVIDISSLNPQKDNYMQIKGSVSQDPVTLYIPASDKNAKIKFDPAAGTIIKAGTNSTADQAGYVYEYRTQYGSWTEFGALPAAAKPSDIDLTIYQQRGATLYFRLAGPDTATLSAADKVTDMKYKDGKDEKELTNVYKVPSLPGKEMKVAVAKKAAGPKVSINYVNNTIQIPANVKWRVNDTAALGTWSAAASSKYTLTDAEAAKLFAGGSLEAKTAKAGRPESKITHLDFPNAKKAVVTGAADADVNNASADQGDISATVTASRDKKGNVTAYTLAVTAKKTASKYGVIVDEAAKKPAVKDKAKVVNPGKTLKIKLAKKAAEGRTVWVHTIGDAKAQKWSSDYAAMGIIMPAADEDSVLESFAASVIDFKNGKTVKYPGNDKSINFLKDGAPKITWGHYATYNVNGKQEKIWVLVNTSKQSIIGLGANNVVLKAEGDATPVYCYLEKSEFQKAVSDGTPATLDIQLGFYTSQTHGIEKTIRVTVVP